jgi:hypothetical protein
MLIIAIVTFLDGMASLTATPCSVTSPGCGRTFVVFVPPVVFNVDVTDPVDAATLDASDLTVNGTPADNVVLSNNNMTISFIFNTSPARQGVNILHIAAGAFNCLDGPVTEFTCRIRLRGFTDLWSGLHKHRRLLRTTPLSATADINDLVEVRRRFVEAANDTIKRAEPKLRKPQPCPTPTPPATVTPLIPATYVACWVPCVPIRMPPESRATPVFPMSMLSLALVSSQPAERAEADIIAACVGVRGLALSYCPSVQSGLISCA